MSIEEKAVENLEHRGESYKEGMLLLIEHLTAKDWKIGTKFSARLDLIKKNIEAIYTDYVKRLDKDASFNQNKKHFDSLLGKYNDILLQHTTLKDAFKALLLAERCSVWKKGRESFKTSVSFISEDSDCSIYSKLIQHETPVFDEENSFQEYIKINNPLLQPLWFERLALWQQNFIKANWRDLCTKSIPSSLRSVPGVANMSRHDFSINNKETLTYFRHATPFPIDLLNQANADEEGYRLTCLNLAMQIRLSLDQEINKPYVGEIREAIILTQSLLSPGTAATLKSQHISDSSDNDTKIYEMKEEVVRRFQIALNEPTDWANENFLAKWDLMVQRDGSLNYKGQSFGKITLLSTNHPLNVLRRFGVHPEQTARNDLNTALLLGAAARYLSNNQDQSVGHVADLLRKLNDCAEKKSISSDAKKDLIKTLAVLLSDEERAAFDKNTLRLFDALQTLLSIPSGQGSLGILGFLGIGDKHHRQSLVSAVEAIIINCMGGTLWVACKSGKDRTGGASAAYDAAAMFYELRGRYPRYEDADRALYLKIYKDLFESGHHQKVALENAPGAEGLIKSKLFLPDDMSLDAQKVELETQLARLNKPKPIRKRSSEVFNNHPLEKILLKIKHDVKKKIRGGVLIDWQRNWRKCFIAGKSVEELRKGEEFKDEADLMRFIEEKLLNEIEDDHLKQYYLALFPYVFHSNGIQLPFTFLSARLAEAAYFQRGDDFSARPDWSVNFSPLKEGVQIEEVVTCNEGVDLKAEKKLRLDEGEYYYQAHSCISVTLSPVKNRGYKLVTAVNNVVVDCKAEELKRHFFKKTGLLEVFREFFASLKRFFKRLVDPKMAKEGLLDEKWLNSLNAEAAKPESAVEHTPEPMKAAKSETAAEQPTTEPMRQVPNLEAGLNMKSEAVNSVFEPISLQDGVSPPVSGPPRQFASQLDLRGNEPSLLVSQGLFQPRIDAQMANRNLSASVPCLVSVGGL